jgi:hypothetical protein
VIDGLTTQNLPSKESCRLDTFESRKFLEQKLIELYVGFLINSLNHNRTSRNTNAALPSPKFKLLLFVVFCFLLSHFRTFLAADVKDMVQYPADSEYYDNLK